MPFRVRRRRTRVRRAPLRTSRRMPTMRVARKLSMNVNNGYNSSVHLFKRKCSLGTVQIANGSTGYTGAAQQFTLDMLPNYTEFTVLFDQYAIRYVKWYLVYRGTSLSMMESANNSALGMPNIVIVRDYDDNTNPASTAAGYAALQEYSKAKTFSFTAERRAFKIGLVPAILSESYRTAVASAYTPKFKQYLDCDTPAVPHYGLKFVVRVPNSGLMPIDVYFDIYATFYVALKNVR